jgi:hypothetical protein
MGHQHKFTPPPLNRFERLAQKVLTADGLTIRHTDNRSSRFNEHAQHEGVPEVVTIDGIMLANTTRSAIEFVKQSGDINGVEGRMIGTDPNVKEVLFAMNILCGGLPNAAKGERHLGEGSIHLDANGCCSIEFIAGRTRGILGPLAKHGITVEPLAKTPGAVVSGGGKEHASVILRGAALTV